MPGAADATRVTGGAEYSVALTADDVPPPVNQAPTARATADCDVLSCDFSGTTSTDPDGAVDEYQWEFDDGATDTGATPSHSYTAAGTYDVTLTVTDDDGATDDTTVQVVVNSRPATGDAAEFRAAAGSSRNSASTSVVVPTSVQVGDVLVMFVSTNRAATASTPAGWTLLGTRSDGTDVRSWAFTRTAVAGTPGSTVSLTLDALSKVDLSLVAYSGGGAVTASVSAAEAGSGTSHVAPAATVSTPGSRVVHYWATKVNSTVTWTHGSDVRRATANGTGSGQVGSVTADAGPAPAGTWPAQAADRERLLREGGRLERGRRAGLVRRGRGPLRLRAQDAELVALRVGQRHPTCARAVLPPQVPHLRGADAEQPLDLIGLGEVPRPQVHVDPVLLLRLVLAPTWTRPPR